MAGIVGFAVIVALALVQLAAFQAGLQEWLGWPWWVAAGIGFFAFWMGGLGALFVAIVGFFGAQSGWGWEWWQAALLCFPSVVLTIAFLAVHGVSSLGQAVFRGRRPEA